MYVCIEYVRFDLNVAIHKLKLLCETPMSTVVELRADLRLRSAAYWMLLEGATKAQLTFSLGLAT
jgi:hypothetical protein